MSGGDAEWKRYEKLAAQIARELQPDASVAWNTRIRGVVSGISRQVDVEIRWRAQDRDMLTIIDCKHWSRPADVNAVGAFAELSRDVGATQGILICSAGFAASVHQYARSLGVSLMLIHDAESALWSQQLTIPILWTDLRPEVSFGFRAGFNAGDQVNIKRFPVARREAPDEDVEVVTLFEQLWNQGNLPMEVGAKYQISVNPVPWAVVAEPGGARALRAMDELRIEYGVLHRSWLGQFTPSICRGLVDVLNGNEILISHLPESEIPLLRDPGWEEIEDPNQVAISLRGSFAE